MKPRSKVQKTIFSLIEIQVVLMRKDRRERRKWAYNLL